ncbi:uncharacterized protein [Dendropsophus ebraccatus]|uniref:uncharacterized protein n=1 Tax=Dendropsophus ebraccatus TaxID=150705 RepID=UPI0038322F6C
MEEPLGHLSHSSNRHEHCKEPWLDFCFQNALLPGSPWHKVLSRISAAFADSIQISEDPTERQIIFQLLGNHFVEKHFSDSPNDPSLVNPSNLSVMEYERLERKIKRQLWDQWRRAAERSGCNTDRDTAEVSPEMTSFIHHTFQLVERAMDSFLAHEANSKSPGMDEELVSRRSFSRKRPKSVESKDLHFAINRRDRWSGDQIQRPPLSSAAADVLARSVCAVVALDPGTMRSVCDRLHGHLCPRTLRRFIWMEKLLRSEKKFKEANISIRGKEARERYGKTLEHRCDELKLRSATRSPISGLIESAVVEKFESTPSMCPFASDEVMIKESSKSLNILYVYNGVYEPYLIHWLFPLQMAFRETPSTAEHPYELFMYLHLLIKNIFPSWLEISAMAERVMAVLQMEDEELFTHLQRIFPRNVTFSPKDFIVELMAREREEAMKLYASSSKPPSLSSLHEEQLANPVIFLRKWMGEGFVNSLDLPAVLLIWDQLFMQNWNRNVMESFCIVLLMLLRDSFMAATDFPAVRQIFLSGGYHLLTADIQKAWIHLQQGGVAADIPAMNRLRHGPIRGRSPRLQGTVHSENLRKIPSFGVRDVVLKISETSLSTIVRDFDPSDLQLALSVYSGHIKLLSKTSTMKPILLEGANKNEATRNHIKFNDLFEFESIDRLDSRNDSESGGNPFVVMKINYSDGEQAVQTLGWAKVDAFEQEARSSHLLWKPRESSSLFSLHPGKEPDNIQECTSSITRSGSADPSIECTVYDPTRKYTSSINHTDGRTEDLSPVPAWVKHNESVVLPDPSTSQEPFILWIDALHHLPDSATIVKVSAKILNSGLKSASEFVAFPSDHSSARNPVFNFCQNLNPEGGKFHLKTYVLFQVTTVEPNSENLVVIGSCMLPVFRNDGRLNVGGFQLRLRTGISLRKLPTLSPPDLSSYPAFPCCSLLVQLRPDTQPSQPVASYTSGYYFSDDAEPTRSEIQIISTFQEDGLFPKSVRDMAERIMEKERSQVSDNHLKDWYETRLGGYRSSLAQPSLTNCNTQNVVRYHQRAGLRVRIRQAFGLEADGLYINAFARILKGTQSTQLPELPERWGGEEKILAQQHDFTSLQRAPRWIDPSVVLHPYLDGNSVLLVQVFGMAATYIPHQSNDQRGHVTSRNGQEIELQPPLGWTVFPLFDRQYVNSGIHSAPLFQGLPNAVQSPESCYILTVSRSSLLKAAMDADKQTYMNKEGRLWCSRLTRLGKRIFHQAFLQSVSVTSVKVAIAEGLKKKTIAINKRFGSMTVEMWDGHFMDGEHPPLPVNNDLLTVSNMKKFLATQRSKKGKELSMLVLESLEKKQRKLQRNSQEYQQHQHFYQEAMGEKFYDLIETALLNAGYAPL